MKDKQAAQTSSIVYPGKSTMTMSHYIYNMSFVQSPNFGYAAAMSILILIMVAILALLQMKVGDER